MPCRRRWTCNWQSPTWRRPLAHQFGNSREGATTRHLTYVGSAFRRTFGPAEAGPYGLGVFYVLLWLTLGVTRCGGGSHEEEAEPPAVPTIVADTAAVVRKTLIDEIVVRGTIAAVPNEDVKVSAL